MNAKSILSQHWFWWASVDSDLCHHRASLGHNELMNDILSIWICPGSHAYYKTSLVIKHTYYKTSLVIKHACYRTSLVIKSILVPCVMASSCYHNQCWLSFMTPYVISRGHWVNAMYSKIIKAEISSFWRNIKMCHMSSNSLNDGVILWFHV